MIPSYTMPKNKQRFNFADEVDFAHDEMSRRAQRTRNGRNKEEREHTMWVEGQVEQLCEAFPQIEECLVREIFLGAGMKYGTTADQLLVLSSLKKTQNNVLKRFQNAFRHQILQQS